MDNIDATRVPKISEESSSPSILSPKHRRRFNRQKPVIQTLDIQEKFSLCIEFMAHNIISKQLSGTMVKRLKGKISKETFTAQIRSIDSTKGLFFNGLNSIITNKREEISLGYLKLHTVDDVTNLLLELFFKRKNENQKLKLRTKVIKQLSIYGIYQVPNEVLNESSNHLLILKEKLMELPPEERMNIINSVSL